MVCSKILWLLVVGALARKSRSVAAAVIENTGEELSQPPTKEARIRRTSSSHHRQLEYDTIAGYEPLSNVYDENALDKDQAEMEKQFATGTSSGFFHGRAIYFEGAFSRPYAEMTVEPPITVNVAAGAKVTGFSMNKTKEVFGSVMEDYSAGSDTLLVAYETGAEFLQCLEGGNPNPVYEGCFSEEDLIDIEGLDAPVSYKYNSISHNLHDRTIQSLSKRARETMLICEETDGCPYRDYEKYLAYYGEAQYGDIWISSAINGLPTKDYVLGVADFGGAGYTEPVRTRAAAKGTVLLNFWMWVIREMEVAVARCQTQCSTENSVCNKHGVHAWDRAVAFYTGSLEGQFGTGVGVLLYSISNALCTDTNTCGINGDEALGTSFVNLQVFEHFSAGQQSIRTGQCESAKRSKDRIVEYMTIPLIQGTLKHAHSLANEPIHSYGNEAEGATFAAAVLPLVHNCSTADAAIIYSNMKTGTRGKVDFKAVKKALQRNYECLGVKCEQIGGIYADGKYAKNAGPCGVENDNTAGMAAGISIGLLAVVGIIVAYCSLVGPKAAPPPELEMRGGENQFV